MRKVGKHVTLEAERDMWRHRAERAYAVVHAAIILVSGEWQSSPYPQLRKAVSDWIAETQNDLVAGKLDDG